MFAVTTPERTTQRGVNGLSIPNGFLVELRRQLLNESGEQFVRRLFVPAEFVDPGRDV